MIVMLHVSKKLVIGLLLILVVGLLGYYLYMQSQTKTPSNEDLAGAPKVIKISTEYNTKTKKLTILSVSPPEEGYAPDYLNQPDHGYTLKVLNNKSKVVYSLVFEAPLYALENKPMPEKVPALFTIPYTSDMATIQLFDPDGVDITNQ